MAESYQTNLLNIAFCYIEKLKVSVTLASFKQSLEENPYYPSLYSLSNTLDRFHIPHEAIKIEKENFDRLTPPFIAYLKNQPTGKDFVLVTGMNPTEVNYIAENKKVKIVSKEAFLNDFEKIVMLAGDIDDKSGEKDYHLNRKKEITQTNKKYALTGAGILVFISCIYFFLNSFPINFIASAATILALKLFGLAVSVLLLIYEIDNSNAFVKSICTAGKQTNCNAVLQSKAGSILGITWSEAGFFYFAGTLLFLWFPEILFTNKIFVLSIASAIVAPYILFSVYYQWKVVKQWCPLCLTVQAVLFLELLWAIINFWEAPFLPDSSLISTIILPIAFCLLVPVSLWYLLKPLLIKAKNEPKYRTAYKRLLYNPDNFNNLLQQQAIAPEGYKNIGITIGNPDAANTIIKVCNPYCGPCAKAHPVIEEILETNNDINLRLIFTASNEENDKRGIISRHLLAISQKQNGLQTKQALNDWYLASMKVYETFAAKYPMNGELLQQESHIEEMSKWCKDAQITGTPTFFINGRKLPDTYSIHELKYIL